MATTPPPFPQGYSSAAVLSGGPGTSAGPLMGPISSTQALYLAGEAILGNYQPLMTYVNQDVVNAESGLAEGTLVQVFLNGWGVTAGFTADSINGMWGRGQVNDPATGELMAAWPGASEIAYVQGDTIVLRWVKGQPWIFWIVVALILLGLLYLLFSTSYSMQKVAKTATGVLTLGGIVPWWVGGLAVVGLGLGGFAYVRFLEAKSLREAGAGKVQIYTGGGGG